MNRAPKLLWILLALICSAGILKAGLPPTTIGAWTSASNLSQARTSAASVLLPDGRILITGGDGGSGSLNSAEFFTANGTISSAIAMNVARSQQFAVVLSDGRVLVGGGNSSGGGTTNSAEIYDAAADSWTQTAPMTSARANASAALLQDGRVLIAGGANSGLPSNTIEIFDPSTGTFSFAGTLSSPRTKQAMALLQDGRVLIIGGFDGTNALASCDIFDPSTGTVSAGPALATPRYSHTATTLLNGQVVVIGGATTGNSGIVDVSSAEVFDPATGVFANAGASLTTAREAHQAFLLPSNNSVLIVGGTSAGQVVPGSELFVPQVSTADGSWSYAFAPTGANITPRTTAVGNALSQDGMLLVAGGSDASGNALASTELYAFPVVKTDASDYPPGTAVTISGSGFKPGEIVNVTLVESPLIDTHGPYAVTADGNGNFSNTSFATDIHDVNVRFWLSAVGSQSGLVAENTFTDANKDSWSSSPNNFALTLNPGEAIPASQTVTYTVANSGPGGTHVIFPVTATTALKNAPAWVNLSKASISISGYGAAGADSVTFSGTVPCTQAAGALTFQVTATLTNNTSILQANQQNTPVNVTITNTPDPSCAVATTTAVTSSANPSVFGQSVSFTATVTPLSGSTAPTGTVQFVVDGSNFGAPVSVAPCSPSPNACATSGSTSALTVVGSAHSVSANYTATGSFTASSGSLSGGQTVNKANTSSTVVSTLNPSSYGQSVTFTATVAAVSPASGTPTGTVDFKDGAAVLASGMALSAGQAAFSTSSLNSTTHSITAVYSGDGNFNATGTGSSTATALSQVVNQANLTTSIIGDPTKPYDGNANATLTAANFSLSGLVGSDSFTINQTVGTYNSKDVAAASTVTAALSPANFTPVGSTSASNYVLPTTASGPGHVTAVSLSASIIGTPTKPYDGNSNATLTPANFSLTGLIGADSFTVTKTTGTYNSKDVLSATTVTTSLAPGDFTPVGTTLASNYNLPLSASGSGQITAVNVTAAIVGAPSKPYDGTTAAKLTAANFQLAGVIAGESITVNQTAGTYNSKDVVSTNTVTASLASANFVAGSGTLLTNYVLPNSASGAGQITPEPVTASLIGTPTKVYDGNTAATLTSANFSLAGVVSGESFTVTQTSGIYNSKDVATATTVTASLTSTDFAAGSGTSASNYSLPTSASGAGQIMPKGLTAAIIGPPSKMYDGTTAAVLTPANFQLSGLIGAEFFTVTQTTGTYDSKNVTATSVSAVLSAADFTPGASTLAGNYTLPTSATGPGTITARQLTVTATGVNKVYDGTASAMVNLSDNRISGDVFADSYTSASFADKNVGTAKALSVSGISISGGDAVNYSLQNTTAATTADITARPLTVTATGITKVYDGGTSATVNLSSNKLTGDSLSLNYANASFADKNIGVGKTVSVSGISIAGGADAGNYSLVNTTTTTTADITPLHITGSFTAENKVYDGTTSAMVLSRTLNGAISTDTVSLSGGTAAFSDKNVGVNKTVTLSGAVLTGADAGNYTLDSITPTTASITPAPLSIAAVTNTKFFDGTVIAAAVPMATGLQTGDTATGLVETYDNVNAGNSKVLSVTSYTVNDGNNGGNYTVTLVANNTGVILAAPTATLLVAAPNPATLGQTVTFTATVSNTKTTPVPTGTVQFVIDGTSFGSPVALASGTASVSTSSLSAGSHVINTVYTSSDGNFATSNGTLANNETVNFGFLGLFAPYQPPTAGVAYKINSAIPLKWQYTDSAGNVVNSPTANPQVYIAGPYPCGGTGTVAEVLALSSGQSGYQYDPTTNTWQFNWKTTGLISGCYNINIKSVLTGQTTGPFPIQLR
jgi:hypothetical protein